MLFADSSSSAAEVDSACGRTTVDASDDDSQCTSSTNTLHTTMCAENFRVTPRSFLLHMLEMRGYEFCCFSSQKYRSAPSSQQIGDYDHELLQAIRNSDLPLLHHMFHSGKSMTACNPFSESILHIACRRSTPAVIEFLITHGADFTITDDFGRIPLHDACWRPYPDFDIVACLLNYRLDLLFCEDSRGSIPLDYIHPDQWAAWCDFLYNQREKYWAITDSSQGSDAPFDVIVEDCLRLSRRPSRDSHGAEATTRSQSH